MPIERLDEAGDPGAFSKGIEYLRLHLQKLLRD